MSLCKKDTALVIIDPQNDFLSTKGVAWPLVGQSVIENNTIANLYKLILAAKKNSMLVFVSPHYYYPYDYRWEFGGKVEQDMKEMNMFFRYGPLTLQGFNNSGADFLDIYKPLIYDGETVITSPHKVYGPENNDLMLQLRKRGINKVILAGMSANLCVESHMRELIERGFEVYMAKDATAAIKNQDMDGYKAALVNFEFISSGSYTTDELINMIYQSEDC